MSMGKYAFVLLAAGNSSRLGKPKALLSYRDGTLIGHVLREMLNIPSYPILVVTGAHHEEIQPELADPHIRQVFNAEWKEGMASSIRKGIQTLEELSPMDGAIFVGCDQPAINTKLFKEMVDKKAATGKQIVACSYGDTVGIPVLFGNKYFVELSQLRGEKGAKGLLERHEEDVATVWFTDGDIDIDTKQDYDAWQKNYGMK